MRDDVTLRRLQRLAAHPGMRRALTDPRCAAAARDSTLRRLVRGGAAVAPVDDELHASLVAATATVVTLDRLAQRLLEEQVESLLSAVIPDQAVPSVLAVTGWAGGRPRTAAAVAARGQLSVSAVTARVRGARARLPQRPWLPALTAAGDLLAGAAPVTAADAASQLLAAGITDRWYSAAALLDLAHQVGEDWRLELVDGPDGGLIVSRRDAAVMRQAAASNSARQRELLAAIGTQRIVRVADLNLSTSLGRLPTTQLAQLAGGLAPIESGWLGNYRRPGATAFDRVLEQLLAVAPQITLSTLNAGLARGMAARRHAWSVRDRVLAAYLKNTPDVTVADGVVTCAEPPPLTVIPAAERQLVEAIRAAPSRTLTRAELVALHTAAGRSPGASRVLLARSAVIERVARATYALRGDHRARFALGQTAPAERTE